MKSVSLEDVFKSPSLEKDFSSSLQLVEQGGLTFVAWGSEVFFREVLGPFGLNTGSV